MDHVGIILESSWDRFGIVLGSLWERFGIVLGSCWDHFGTFFGFVGDNCGIMFPSCSFLFFGPPWVLGPTLLLRGNGPWPYYILYKRTR